VLALAEEREWKLRVQHLLCRIRTLYTHRNAPGRVCPTSEVHARAPSVALLQRCNALGPLHAGQPCMEAFAEGGLPRLCCGLTLTPCSRWTPNLTSRSFLLPTNFGTSRGWWGHCPSSTISCSSGAGRALPALPTRGGIPGACYHQPQCWGSYFATSSCLGRRCTACGSGAAAPKSPCWGFPTVALYSSTWISAKSLSLICWAYLRRATSPVFSHPRRKREYHDSKSPGNQPRDLRNVGSKARPQALSASSLFHIPGRC
jgi:hypothetical protein